MTISLFHSRLSAFGFCLLLGCGSAEEDNNKVKGTNGQEIDETEVAMSGYIGGFNSLSGSTSTYLSQCTKGMEALVAKKEAEKIQIPILFGTKIMVERNVNEAKKAFDQSRGKADKIDPKMKDYAANALASYTAIIKLCEEANGFNRADDYKDDSDGSKRLAMQKNILEEAGKFNAAMGAMSKVLDKYSDKQAEADLANYKKGSWQYDYRVAMSSATKLIRALDSNDMKAFAQAKEKFEKASKKLDGHDKKFLGSFKEGTNVLNEETRKLHRMIKEGDPKADKPWIRKPVFDAYNRMVRAVNVLGRYDDQQ